MLESRSSHVPGVAFGFILLAGVVLLDLGLLLLLGMEPLTFVSFLWGTLLLASLPALVFITYWTTALKETRYHVRGAAVVIEWGRIRKVVPLEQIIGIYPGEALAKVRKFRGIRWPGCFVGLGRVSYRDQTIDEQDTLFFATRPLREQLLLVTDSIAYGLSPIDAKNFADCLEALRVAEIRGRGETPESDLSVLDWPIWRDRVAHLILAIVAVLNLTLFAYLCAIFRRLPAQIPLHFDASGIVDRMASPTALFVLPFLGLFSWMANGGIGWIFYQKQREPQIAYLPWAASVLVQLLTWVGALVLLA